MSSNCPICNIKISFVEFNTHALSHKIKTANAFECSSSCGKSYNSLNALATHARKYHTHSTASTPEASISILSTVEKSDNVLDGKIIHNLRQKHQQEDDNNPQKIKKVCHHQVENQRTSSESSDWSH